MEKYKKIVIICISYLVRCQFAVWKHREQCYIFYIDVCCSCSVVSNSLPPHGLQHTRFPCPSLSPRVCSNLYPLSQGCHPTILLSVISSYWPQSFTRSGSFPMSWLFASCGQSIGASASASIFPVNIQSWYLTIQKYHKNMIEI